MKQLCIYCHRAVRPAIEPVVARYFAEGVEVAHSRCLPKEAPRCPDCEEAVIAGKQHAHD
jgi:hypothetical protein